MATPEQIGKTVIKLRRVRGISQETLANEAGIDRRYMSDVENGKRNISLDVLNRLASFFGITVGAFLDEVELSDKEFKTVAELKELLIQEEFNDTVVLEEPSYLSAILGINEEGRVIYSYDKMIQHLMLTSNMSYEESVEFIDYNTIRAIPYMGKKSPIILYRV